MALSVKKPRTGWVQIRITRRASFSCQTSLNFKYCSLTFPSPHRKVSDLFQRTLPACVNTARKSGSLSPAFALSRLTSYLAACDMSTPIPQAASSQALLHCLTRMRYCSLAQVLNLLQQTMTTDSFWSKDVPWEDTVAFLYVTLFWQKRIFWKDLPWLAVNM